MYVGTCPSPRYRGGRPPLREQEALSDGGAEAESERPARWGNLTGRERAKLIPLSTRRSALLVITAAKAIHRECLIIAGHDFPQSIYTAFQQPGRQSLDGQTEKGGEKFQLGSDGKRIAGQSNYPPPIFVEHHTRSQRHNQRSRKALSHRQGERADARAKNGATVLFPEHYEPTEKWKRGRFRFSWTGASARQVAAFKSCAMDSGSRAGVIPRAPGTHRKLKRGTWGFLIVGKSVWELLAL